MVNTQMIRRDSQIFDYFRFLINRIELSDSMPDRDESGVSEQEKRKKSREKKKLRFFMG